MRHFFLFIAGVMMAYSSMAGGISQCSVDTVPIQLTNEKGSGPETILSDASVSDLDPHFRTFVTAITEHVALRLAENKLCIKSEESSKPSLLEFVNWPLETSGNDPLASVPSLDAAHMTTGCGIISPWLDLYIERTPTPWIRGVVRWNERQLLADQAVLDGARNVPDGVAHPLKLNEFDHLISDYSNSEILFKQSTKPVEQRIPPDLLWLFRHSWQSTRAPFDGNVKNAMRNTKRAGAEQYTKLVITLVDRCFDDGSDETVHHYNNILDAADLIPLEQYKINKPIR